MNPNRTVSLSEFSFFEKLELRLKDNEKETLKKGIKRGPDPESTFYRHPKSNWLVVLRCRLFSSFVELKGHEHVANAVTLGIQ